MTALMDLVAVIATTFPPPAVCQVAADEGHNVTLPCQAPRTGIIDAVNWTRTDLNPEMVFLHWDGHPDPDNQHPSYTGRVELDHELKTGNVSLVLSDVRSSDKGTYTCTIKEREDPTDQVTTSLICTVHLSVPVSDTQVNVMVKPGDDATLECRAHRNGTIEQMAWSKTDLKSDKYVFYFRENRSYEKYQLPSLRGRVELRDPQMKEGDASVVLKNVTANDSGPYECSVSMSGGHRRKRAAPFRHIVHLKVEDSGPKAGGSEEGGNLRGHSGLMVLMAVPVVISVSVAIHFLVYKRPMKKNSEQPAADEKQQLSTESVEVQCQSEV